jgi:hypothetical protein
MSGRVCRAASAAGVAASALAHLVSFTPLGARVPEAVIVALFAGALILLVVMLARLRSLAAPTRAWRRLEVYDWRGVIRRVPPPLRRLVAATAAYALLNFGLSVLAEAGALRVASGHCLLFYLIPFAYFAHVEPSLG